MGFGFVDFEREPKREPHKVAFSWRHDGDGNFPPEIVGYASLLAWVRLATPRADGAIGAAQVFWHKSHNITNFVVKIVDGYTRVEFADGVEVFKLRLHFVVAQLVDEIDPEARLQSRIRYEPDADLVALLETGPG